MGFMIPDLLAVMLPLQELGEMAGRRRVRPQYLVSTRLAGTSLATAALIWLASLAL